VTANAISVTVSVPIAIGSLIHVLQLFLIETIMTAASGKVIHPLLSIVQWSQRERYFNGS